MAGTTIFVILLVIVAAIAGFIFFVGVPAEWKSAVQQEIVEQMAESQTKELLKENLGKIPEADVKNAQKIEKGINKMTGGDLKNPLGGLTSQLKKE